MFKHLVGEALVIGNTALSHQGRVGGKTLDKRIGTELQNTIQVGAICKDFYFQLIQRFHCLPFQNNIRQK